MAEDHDTLAQQLADSRWVTALARRLCADAATADDLAQEAWLGALEARRTPALGPSESPRARAWFRRVVLNFARQRARGDARRSARERHAARPEPQPEDDLVARAEASTRLVAHVLALDEPYRQVLLARYIDGLEPDELARRTGVNPSTVRRSPHGTHCEARARRRRPRRRSPLRLARARARVRRAPRSE